MFTSTDIFSHTSLNVLPKAGKKRGRLAEETVTEEPMQKTANRFETGETGRPYANQAMTYT